MRFAKSLSAALLAGAALTSLAPAAAATPGQVVAFTHEFTPLRIWDNPTGCHALDPGTHLIFNQLDRPITIYADPACLFPIEPFARVKPGFGSHVSAVGSFRA
ncbi:hypothetical protein [Actinokineospora sp. HUAS TT18]|uniref:hypothetical protein n=1 Tax=Actinokineospora sp. HUAS TT18 TaxID=3447451 RepID=UPI003F528EA6